MTASAKLAALDGVIRLPATEHEQFMAKNKSALALVNALPAIRALVEAGKCLRFTMTPCLERPEIKPDRHCAWCRALAALDAALDGADPK